MRGILSEAMVMCAFTTDPETSQFIDPPPGSAIGDRIKCDGYEGMLILVFQIGQMVGNNLVQHPYISYNL